MIVYVTTFLVYSKDYMLVLRPICVLHIIMMSFIQNLLYSSLWPYDLWLCHLDLRNKKNTLTKNNKRRNNKKEMLNKKASIQASHFWYIR